MNVHSVLGIDSVLGIEGVLEYQRDDLLIK